MEETTQKVHCSPPLTMGNDFEMVQDVVFGPDKSCWEESKLLAFSAMYSKVFLFDRSDLEEKPKVTESPPLNLTGIGVGNDESQREVLLKDALEKARQTFHRYFDRKSVSMSNFLRATDLTNAMIAAKFDATKKLNFLINANALGTNERMQLENDLRNRFNEEYEWLEKVNKFKRDQFFVRSGMGIWSEFKDTLCTRYKLLFSDASIDTTADNNQSPTPKPNRDRPFYDSTKMHEFISNLVKVLLDTYQSDLIEMLPEQSDDREEIMSWRKLQEGKMTKFGVNLMGKNNNNLNHSRKQMLLVRYTFQNVARTGLMEEIKKNPWIGRAGIQNALDKQRRLFEKTIVSFCSRVAVENELSFREGFLEQIRLKAVDVFELVFTKYQEETKKLFFSYSTSLEMAVSNCVGAFCLPETNRNQIHAIMLDTLRKEMADFGSSVGLLINATNTDTQATCKIEPQDLPEENGGASSGIREVIGSPQPQLQQQQTRIICEESASADESLSNISSASSFTDGGETSEETPPQRQYVMLGKHKNTTPVEDISKRSKQN